MFQKFNPIQMNWKLLIIWVGFSLFVTPNVLAANSGTGPGAEQHQFEVNEAEVQVQKKLISSSSKSAVDISNQLKKPVMDENVEALSFYIGSIVTEGNQILSDETIQQAVAEYTGREITLNEAKEAASLITDLYHEKGYVTCRAFLPPQKIEDKVLKIKIMEGVLDTVKVKGSEFFKESRIRNYFSKVEEGPVDYELLKKQMKIVNEHPDRDVKAVLSPGDDMGTSNLILNVEEQNPFSVGIEVNNFGTKLTGKERYNLSATHSNLTGNDDILSTRVQYGDEVFGVGAQYVMPLNYEGTRLGIEFNYTDVNIGGDFTILDLAGAGERYNAYISHPIVNEDKSDIRMFTGLESKSISSEILGTEASKDELRIVHVGVTWNQTDPYGRTFFVHDVGIGTPWLGASDKHHERLSRANSGATFVKYRAAMNRIHPVKDGIYLYMKGAVQLSADPLVSAEQYSIGGFHSVRGYPQSDYLGDSAGGGTMEVRVPAYFIPAEIKVPGGDESLWKKTYIVAFFDGAYAKLKTPAIGENPSRSFMGTGGGIRIELPQNFISQFEWATPIGDDPSDLSDSQFYFSVARELI